MNREQEIQRLGVQVEISRAQQYAGGVGAGGTVETFSAGSSAAIQDIGVAKRRIDQLEMQIEHLQEYIEGLEKVRRNDCCFPLLNDLAKFIFYRKYHSLTRIKRMSFQRTKMIKPS